MSTATSVTVPCERCGASLPAALELEQCTCEYCGTTFPIASELRKRAVDYREQISTAWRQEIKARCFQLMHQRQARANPRLIRWLALFLLLVLAWAYAWPLQVFERLPPAYTWAWLVLSWVTGAALVGGMGDPGEPITIEMLIASGLGECQNCGGPLRVPEGMTSQRCPHCLATVLVDETQRRKLLADALRRVAPAQARLADAAYLNQLSVRSTALFDGLFPGLSLTEGVCAAVFLGGVLLAVVTAQLIANQPPIRDTSWVLPTLAAGIGVSGVYVVFILRKAIRDRKAIEAIVGERMPVVLPRS